MFQDDSSRGINMAKGSRKQIDIDEKKIISELQKNAKESIDKIAKRYKFSVQKVRRVIKRLEGDKTIWGYPAVIDDEKLGVKRYQILLKRSSKSVSDKMSNMIPGEDMRKKLEKFGVKFDCSFYTHGYFDWSLCITAPNIIAVKKFVELLNKEFGDNISDTQVLEVVFPLLKSGIDNPNLAGVREFFSY
jgi:DNA-binding Lrp family transcriptional regulator